MMIFKFEKNHPYIVAAAAGVLILAILIATLFFLKTDKKNKHIQNEQPLPVLVDTNALSGQAAEELALEKAKLWRPDAVLSYLESGSKEAGSTGSWRLIYVSPSLKKRGYEIMIADKEIMSSQEIDYSGKGEEFPVKSKMTQEQAVAQVKKMPGYENAEILGINAVYGAGTKTWYWGIKTSKGVVSIEMK